MATRKIRALDVNIGDQAEAQAAKLLRGAAPWAGWLLAAPLAGTGFEFLGRSTHQQEMVAVLLAAAGAGVSWFAWRMTHSRKLRRIQEVLTTFTPFCWAASVTRYGWTGHHDLPLITWAVGGPAVALAWNITHTVHDPAGAVDVMPGPPKQKAVDAAYLVRVAAGRAPVIRSIAERAGKAVPALTGPWRGQPAAVAPGPAPLAITAGSSDPVDPAARARAQASAVNIVRNFRDFTATKATELNGARMRVLGEPMPWRIRTEVKLVRGVQIPKQLLDRREHLASQNGLPLSSVSIRPDRRDHSRAFADFILEDVLADVRHWPGPQAIGRSIADAPVRYGVYEDRVYAESWETAVTADMAKRLGIPERNLSHIISEGMTGSGKSTVIRIVIADGATRLDVEDWAVDPVKKYQTLGCVAGALGWFAADMAESKALVKFLANRVIPARANYLGMHGYDNWEPGCGLPFLRVTVEEGNVIADELDHLDDVLNSARSAGVKIRGSFQRAHHAVLDTNVRAAFGESLSFGVKDSADTFVLPDDLRDAGADPSQWADRQPGMHYRSASGIPLDRQVMGVRSFTVDQAYCREIVNEHAPHRDAWIAGNCPDWAEMLREIDVQGVYAGRTTGEAVLGQIESAGRRKSARSASPAVPQAAPPVLPAVMGEDDEIFMGELVDDEEAPVTLEELDVDDPDLAGGIAEDEGTDPRAALPEADPEEADAIDFTRPARPDVSRDEAVARLRAVVTALGAGAEFYPRDIYEDACEATGRSAPWVRGELGGTLAAEGLVLADRGTGIYTVTDKALEAA